MPKRTDINSIMIIGAGPIVIGQACEFDYSGTQAVKALKAEGYRVVLVNSNPATIMTDPELADATYVEPITPEIVAKIIEKERAARPDEKMVLLPTMGGQTALNTALSLRKMGVLDRLGIEMIGAKAEAIDKAEDRELFREAMQRIGLETPKAAFVNTSELKKRYREEHAQRIAGIEAEHPEGSSARADALAAFAAEWNAGERLRRDEHRLTAQLQALHAVNVTGLPAIVRPSFTLGGTGGGIAYTLDELYDTVLGGLDASPTNEVLVEESVLGWKEFEMEVVRDRHDNCIIVCSIENVDPMGVHTGNSITVAPALTLTDKEFQMMRTASIAVLREIGVETGGSNVQFAVNPRDGRLVVIEMNPRVSRSSALASKATGFPIAKIAAKLAVGYTLDELDNDITGGATPASFEPTIDYVVTKVPRFAFEKFPGAEPVLTTSMKSVGEVMAIGRTFAESLQKALRGLETGLDGLDEVLIPGLGEGDDKNAIRAALSTPTPDRLLVCAEALRLGATVDEIHAVCAIDPWFLRQLQGIVESELEVRAHGLPDIAGPLRRLKAQGFSDARLASLARTEEAAVAALRARLGVHPSYKRIDTCAAEFASPTAYLYSTYEAPFAGVAVNEAEPSEAKKVIILGGGPNRIGQGIEFDYCCCHACFALADAGYESIMVNCNPETVSTDYDTSDRLYFEPLTAEDVLEIVRVEQSKGTLAGVIVQFGGQTPLKLARALQEAHVPILGTSPDMIDLAEDRDRFARLLTKLGLKQAKNGIAYSVEQSRLIAADLGLPLVVRPSYVLGGRAMQIIRSRGAAFQLPARHPARAGAGRRQGALPQRQDRADQHRARQEPAALRPLPVGRHRDRRRRARRRHHGLYRRHHGAHRGGGHPLRRFGLLAAALFALRRGHRRAGEADPRTRPGARRARPDERAVRAQGRRPLRARGQSARLAHGAVRGQVDRPAGRQDCRPGDGRRGPRRLRSQYQALGPCGCQGSGFPVRPLPQRRHPARPRNALHRRGDGPRHLVRRRLRQEPARRRQPAADLRHGVHFGARRRQGAGCRAGETPGKPGFQGHRHLRDAAIS